MGIVPWEVGWAEKSWRQRKGGVAGLGFPGAQLWHVEVQGGLNHPLWGVGPGTEWIPDSWKCLYSGERNKYSGNPDARLCLLAILSAVLRVVLVLGGTVRQRYRADTQAEATEDPKN